MGPIGFPEIMIILLIVLLLFGAKRIPEIAGSFGKGIKEFKRSMTDVERSISEPLRDDRAERLPRGDAQPAPRAQEEEESRPEPKRLLS
ncbi:MAG TPA: twin-arginine translocase TatA/TatE family subunit [Gemmatimonadaceae bacterium]|nr:twin-arginine translocase TatA/TatE family subunit [Gemmatimonadaceae bacterium]